MIMIPKKETNIHVVVPVAFLSFVHADAFEISAVFVYCGTLMYSTIALNVMVC